MTAPWPPWHETELIRRWNRPESAAAIARHLPYSQHEVRHAVDRLRRRGIPMRGGPGTRRDRARGHANPDRTLRDCLYCQQPFPSEHIGNRLCGGCLAQGPFASGVAL